jgi:hypothetical protein
MLFSLTFPHYIVKKECMNSKKTTKYISMPDLNSVSIALTRSYAPIFFSTEHIINTI